MSQAVQECIASLKNYSHWKAFHWRHHRALAASMASEMERRLANGDLVGCKAMIDREVARFRTPVKSKKLNVQGGFFKVILRARHQMEAEAAHRREMVEQNEAAGVLVRGFRNMMGKRVYDRMIKGTIHQELETRFETLPPIEAFRTISRNNLKRLRSLVMTRGKTLDPREAKILDSMVTGKIFLVHHSTHSGLVKPNQRGNDAISLYSREKLIDKEILFRKTNTTPVDILCLKDDDFVFFSVVTYPTAKERSRFGTNAYVVEVDDSFFRNRHVFMTAGDYAAEQNKIKMKSRSAQVIEAYFRDMGIPKPNVGQMMKIKKIYGDCLYNCFQNYEVPLTEAMQHHCFMEGDILPGLAFMVILFRRLILEALSEYGGEDPAMKGILANICERLAQPELSPAMLNALINSVVNPLIKVPRLVIMEGAQKVDFGR